MPPEPKSKDDQTTAGWIAQKALQGASQGASFMWRQLSKKDWLAEGEDHGDKVTSSSVESQYRNARDLIGSAAEKIKRQVTVPGSIDCLDSFDTYLESRTNIMGAEGNPPVEKHPITVATSNIQQQFKDAKDVILKEIIEGNQVGVFSLVNHLKELEDRGRNALINQYAEDTKTIQNGTLNQEDQAKLLDELKLHHEKALEKFKETMDAEIKKQFSNARFENSRLALLKLLHDKTTKEMQRFLDQSAEAEGVDVTLSSSPVLKIDPGLRHAKLNDVTEFKTLSGLTARQTAPGEFSMHIPWRGNIFYHNSSQDNVLADLKLIALAVHATGSETLTIKLEGSNQEELKLLAQKAYQAAIQVGFDSGTKGDKEERYIKIKVNGTLLPLIDTVDEKTNKTTQGVFRSQADMDNFCALGAQVRKDRDALEAEDMWVDDVPISLSSGAVPISLSSGAVPVSLNTGGVTQQYRAQNALFVASGAANAAPPQPSDTDTAAFTAQGGPL